MEKGVEDGRGGYTNTSYFTDLKEHKNKSKSKLEQKCIAYTMMAPYFATSAGARNPLVRFTSAYFTYVCRFRWQNINLWGGNTADRETTSAKIIIRWNFVPLTRPGTCILRQHVQECTRVSRFCCDRWYLSDKAGLWLKHRAHIFAPLKLH